LGTGRNHLEPDLDYKVDAATMKIPGVELHLLLLHLCEAWRVTHLAKNFRNPRTPIMCPTLSLEIPNATAIPFFFMRRFPRGSVLQRDLNEADHLQSLAFHFVFCHSDLLAPVLNLSTALPSVLLYSHQHTDHHKRLAFFCEFQLEEFFHG